MKVILDTNIYFSALCFGNKLLGLVNICFDNNTIEIYFSPKTIKELEDKLNSTKFAKVAIAKITKDEINSFLLRLTQFSNFVEPTKSFNICRDPDDNMILDLAFEIDADYIITGDSDLLILNPFENTKIVKPSEFAALLWFELAKYSLRRIEMNR